jgi:DNA-binding CsgD family transcriptional regulator
MIDSIRVDFSEPQVVALHILDRFSIGIVLLDSTGHILFANTSARSFMHNGQRLGPRTLIFERLPPGSSRRVEELIERTQGGEPMIAVTVPYAVEGSSLVLLASRLRRNEATQLGRGLQHAVTILFLCDPMRPIELPVAWVIDAYGLTHAEARAALSASSGMTVAAMARQLDLSPNTIKTHLRKVFAKTGTGRQAELTRLVTSLAVVRDP